MNWMIVYWISVGITISVWIIPCLKLAKERGLGHVNTFWAIVALIVSFIPVLNICLVINLIVSLIEDRKAWKRYKTRYPN